MSLCHLRPTNPPVPVSWIPFSSSSSAASPGDYSCPFICLISFITDSFLNIHACILHTSLQQRPQRTSVQHALCLAVDGQWGTNHLVYTSLRRRWTMISSLKEKPEQNPVLGLSFLLQVDCVDHSPLRSPLLASMATCSSWFSPLSQSPCEGQTCILLSNPG